MIDTELKELIRKAYKAGRRNALKQDEANLNDFINKHESKLKLFAIPAVVGQSEQLVCGSCNRELDQMDKQVGLCYECGYELATEN